LTAAILAYYKCASKTYWTPNSSSGKRRKAKFEYGLLGGFNFTDKAVPGSLLNPTSISNLPGVSFGLLGRVYLPKGGYRYSIDFGFSINQIQARNILTKEISEVTYSPSFPLRLTRYFSLGKSRLFTSVGLRVEKRFQKLGNPFSIGMGYDLKVSKRTRIALLVNSQIIRTIQGTFVLALFFS